MSPGALEGGEVGGGEETLEAVVEVFEVFEEVCEFVLVWGVLVVWYMRWGEMEEFSTCYHPLGS